MKVQMRGHIMLLGVLIAASIACTGSQAGAVGPYFENESAGNGRFQGPNPAWPKPGEPLWSPSSPPLLSIESLRGKKVSKAKNSEHEEKRVEPSNTGIPPGERVAQR